MFSLANIINREQDIFSSEIKNVISEHYSTRSGESIKHILKIRKLKLNIIVIILQISRLKQFNRWHVPKTEKQFEITDCLVILKFVTRFSLNKFSFRTKILIQFISYLQECKTLIEALKNFNWIIKYE